jgi:anti-sigma factor RsiW
MTCREFADFIMDYTSGEVSPDVRRDFETHLTRCPNCQKYLAGYRQTIALGRRAFDDDDGELPGDVPEDLVKAIMAARRE